MWEMWFVIFTWEKCRQFPYQRSLMLVTAFSESRKVPGRCVLQLHNKYISEFGWSSIYKTSSIELQLRKSQIKGLVSFWNPFAGYN